MHEGKLIVYFFNSLKFCDCCSHDMYDRNKNIDFQWKKNGKIPLSIRYSITIDIIDKSNQK